MQPQWYGDRRDLVKWGTLLELSRSLRLKHILQVLYFRANKWAPIVADGKGVQISKNVIRHFRNLKSVKNICRDVSVEILAEEFCDRKKYLESVELRITRRRTRPGIVFLDPDTGLEPESGRFGHQHVTEAELFGIWQALFPGDLLAFYQHQDNHAGREWKERKRLQFAGALALTGTQTARVKLAHAPKAAHDVAFFFVQKR